MGASRASPYYYEVPWAVAVMFLGEPLFDRHGLAVRQHAGQRLRRRLELQEGRGESAFAGLDDGARLVCDQPARHGIGVLGVTQVAAPSRVCKPVVARSAV